MAYESLDRNQQDRLDNYVKDAISKGYSFDAIKEQLKRYNYADDDIEPLRSRYAPSLPGIFSRTIGGMRGGLGFLKAILANKAMLAVIFGLLLLILVPSVILMLPEGRNCGTDESCFLGAAQDCEPARLTQDISGTIFSYRITSACTLVKRIEKVGEEEPPVFKDIFEGKAMTCDYQKGGFNPAWVGAMTKDLTGCEGELKARLLELTLASYQL